MFRLSVLTRQALSRLTLPALFALSFAVMLIGKADTVLVDQARVQLGDALGPLYALLARPAAELRASVADLATLWSMRTDNARLRAEVRELRRWQDVALALEQENARLKSLLTWIPDPSVPFVTARVVADDGGLYARAVLLALGPKHGVRKGEIALDGTGLVGRVTEVGTRTARVLLITDISSRIPVLIQPPAKPATAQPAPASASPAPPPARPSGEKAIMAGTNGSSPRLLYWSEAAPEEGARVVTSGEANAFPPNLPVGTVHWTATHVPEVVPAADMDHLAILRLFDYRLGGGSAAESNPAGKSAG